MKIKTIYVIIGILLPALTLIWSCAKDNYDPPKISFTGRLMYKGQPLSFNGNTDNGDGAEIIQLYQHGFGKNGALNVRVNQDGHFSSLLFPGDYVMIFKDQDYPFFFDDWPMKSNGRPDSVYFTLKENTTMDINVTPFLEINDAHYSVATTTIDANFKLAEAVKGISPKKAYLYISTAINVNKNTPLSEVIAITAIDDDFTIKIPITKYRETYINNYRTYAYARIAVETDRSPEFVWSPVFKIENIPVGLSGADVTKNYLKNAGPGFSTLLGSIAKGSAEILRGLEGTPSDWTVNDAIKIYNGWGGIDQRWDRDRICVVNWDATDRLILNGKIYQTTTLPAGKYALIASFGELAADQGTKDHCYMIVNKGNQSMPDWNEKETAFRYSDMANDQTVEFELTEQTTVTIGFLYNFPTLYERCSYGFDWIKLYQYKSE